MKTVWKSLSGSEYQNLKTCQGCGSTNIVEKTIDSGPPPVYEGVIEMHVTLHKKKCLDCGCNHGPEEQQLEYRRVFRAAKRAAGITPQRERELKQAYQQRKAKA